MPNEVGTITLRADSRQIDKGTKSLRGMAKQAGRTEGQVDKVAKASGRLGKTLGRLVAGVSVGLFARKVIQNTKEQEQAIAAVNNTLRSTGRYSDEASAALQRQAAAFQQLTTFSDEEVLRGQELLLTFRKIGGDVFPQATEATLNLATKMGTDLKSAALQVGKALEDPATQMTYLVRSGISFSQQQKEMAREMQRAGNIAGAQAIVLEELEKQFGGTARAARNTFGGALSAVSNAFNDLLEGKAGNDGVRGATSALNELEDTLQSPEMQAAFQTMIGSIATTVEWLAKGVKGFADFGTGIGEFFGELVNGPTLEDPAGIRAELEAQREELERSENAWFDFGREEHNEGIRKRIKVLEDLLSLTQDLNLNKPEPGAPDVTSAIPFAEDPDAILIPIEVDNDKLKDRIRKTTAEFQSELRRLGETASRELSDALAESSAELGGPAAEANLAYARSLEEINAWQRELETSNQLTAEKQQELNQLRENAEEINRRELAIIEERRRAKEAELTPTERLIEALELELDLMKLGANEREREVVQRQLAGKATEEQLAQLDALILKRQEAEQSIAALDEVRGATQGFLIDLGEGSKSVGDAFDDMFDRIRDRALQLATEKLIEKIFGAFGTAGGGAGGGFLGDLFSGLFGGGRARGGPVSPNTLYRVNEQTPEMLSIGDRDYLMTGHQAGTVTPLNQVTNHNDSKQIFNLNFAPTTPRRLIEQAAVETHKRNRRNTARNA